MGFKARKRVFTGTLRASVMGALRAGGPMGKRALLARVRRDPVVTSSKRKLAVGLGRLLDAGKIRQLGTRADTKFGLVEH